MIVVGVGHYVTIYVFVSIDHGVQASCPKTATQSKINFCICFNFFVFGKIGSRHRSGECENVHGAISDINRWEKMQSDGLCKTPISMNNIYDR